MKNNLRSINLSLSTICSANCIFCPNDKGEFSIKKIMPFDIAKKIIDEIAETELFNTVTKIEISENGDPLMNPDMVKILRYIKLRLPNVHIDLFSNFFLLNKNTADILLSEKLVNSVFVNIDSVNEDYYKELKGLNLNVVLENLKTFITIRNSIYSSLPVYIIIISLQKYIQTTITRLGVIPVKLSIPNYDTIKNDSENTKQYLIKELLLQPNDSINIYDKIMLWAERKSITSKHRKGKCANINRIINEAFISPDGDWYICCFDSSNNIKFGNVIEKSIIEIANCEKRKKIIELLKNEKFEEIGYPCTTSICCEIS